MPTAAALAALLVTAIAQSGRPPVGPLERIEPRLIELRFEVTLSTEIRSYAIVDDRRQPGQLPRGRSGELFPAVVAYQAVMELADTPIVMPMLLNGAYSRVDHDSIKATLRFGSTGREESIGDLVRLDSGYPYGGHALVIPIREFRGRTLSFEVELTTQSWSSRIDDAEAGRLTWPDAWPAEVREALAPQRFIESDDPRLREMVDRITGGRHRLVPPYFAVKEILRHVVTDAQLAGTGVLRGRAGTLHGYDIGGARAMLDDEIGTPTDLVCLCVAVLRAAGVPTRPVVGVTNYDHRGEKQPANLAVWAEFWLPGAGWIPFDPNDMRGRIGGRPFDQSWTGFGTMRHLNRRVPLAYHFIPPRTLEVPQAAAIWAWDPRPDTPPAPEQHIRINLTSRGRGEDDPR